MIKVFAVFEKDELWAPFTVRKIAEKELKLYIKFLTTNYGIMAEEEKKHLIESFTIQEFYFDEFKNIYPDKQINPYIERT